MLPFDNMSGDPDQAYFADGIVEDLITALSRVRWLFVVARQSSSSHRGSPLDAKRIGRARGVSYLFQGSVRRAGQRVRLSWQLVEAATGRRVLSDRVDGDLGDIFALQDLITASVVTAIEPGLRSAEIDRARRKPKSDLGAYDLLLRALPAMDAYTAEGYAAAEGLLRQALALDPDYPDALAALAECLGRRAVNGWGDAQTDAAAQACALAAQAAAADLDNAAVLANAAWASALLGARFEQSLELAERALEMHPNSVHVRASCGWVLTYCGDPEGAIAHFEEARRLNPVDPRGYFPLLGLAAAHFFPGRFEESLRRSERILGEVPTHKVARRYRAAALAHLGRLAEAQAVAGELNAARTAAGGRLPLAISFRDPRMAAPYADGLAKAGVRE